MSTKNYMKGKVIANLSPLTYLKTLLPVVLLIQITGCVSDSVTEDGFISSYQKVVVNKSPQPRDSNEGLESLRPSPEPDVLKLNVTKDETTGKNIVKLSLDDAVKRLHNILNEQLPSNVIDNFRALGEHRNQIVHFAHTDYIDLNATKASVIIEQWTSWHYLHQLLTSQWKDVFKKYFSSINRIHKRMLEQTEFIKARYKELTPKIAILIKQGKKIIDCEHCEMKSAVIKDTHEWGSDYNCIICKAEGQVMNIHFML